MNHLKTRFPNDEGLSRTLFTPPFELSFYEVWRLQFELSKWPIKKYLLIPFYAFFDLFNAPLARLKFLSSPITQPLFTVEAFTVRFKFIRMIEGVVAAVTKIRTSPNFTR